MPPYPSDKAKQNYHKKGFSPLDPYKLLFSVSIIEQNAPDINISVDKN
jgi:hypothetical protein